MAIRLKSGKLKLKIGPDEGHVLKMAIKQALEFDGQDIPDYLYYLLIEVLDKIENDKWTFRKSEFFALASPTVMNYVDIPTQSLLRQAFEIEENNKHSRLPEAQIHVLNESRQSQDNFN